MGSRLRSTVAAALIAAVVVPSAAVAGPTGGALPPVLIDVHRVAGVARIPDDATMIAATVTAIRPADRGWIKVFPCDQPEPTTANLNYETDQVINNLVLSRIADDGTICVATHAIADYVIDLAGYVPAGSDITPLDSPVRALNTRNESVSPVPAYTTTTLQLAGDTLPDTAQLAIFNLTAVSTDAYGYITAFPCNQTPAATSNVNYAPGRAVANLVITRLAPDGTICFRNNNAVDIIVDVAGYATNGIVTLPTPQRILNTRDTPGPVPADHTTTIDPDLPAGATAAIYNLTIAEAQAPGHATAYPCDEAVPRASNVNHPATVAGGAASITKLDPTGRFCIHNLAAAELIIDLTGYTTGTTHYLPITPTRLHDTRQGWQPSCPWLFAPRWEGLERGHLVDRYPLDGGAPITLGGFYDPSNMMQPGVSLDCEQLLFFGAGSTPFSTAFIGLHTDGSGTRTMLGDQIGLYQPRAVQQLSDGSYLAVGIASIVIDPTTGDIVWQHPGRDVYTYRAAISRSGLVALRTGGHPNTTRDGDGQIEIWDVRADRLIASIPVPRRNLEFDMSPDGTYLAIDLGTDRTHDTATTIIATIFGSVLETRTHPVDTVTRFLGAGTLAECQNGRSLTRHDLFGPWDQGFLPAFQPGPPNRSTSCSYFWA